ncbi:MULTISPECIES: amino acid synthesis family protein [unclassified Roseibium]|uniref:amino acid synthesis family protein n=1 Tax=unclassified Roseibium TaxID=2629323 RepID=UPI002740223C|nr:MULTISPECIES: amino acid synthesis family protein [unclassified Roseibium]
MHIRKTVLIRELTETDETGVVSTPQIRCAAMAVIQNPFAGLEQDDLSALFESGAMLGEKLAADVVKSLGGPAVSYGKAAIVGLDGIAEHGAALLHPRFGKPVRSQIGGGQALMPSNVKVGAMGVAVDLPLGHKDEAWSFDHIDTMTVSLADAPRADEIVVCLGMADGPRVRARVGSGPTK